MDYSWNKFVLILEHVDGDKVTWCNVITPDSEFGIWRVQISVGPGKH